MEAQQCVESRSTNMPRLLCGTLYVTSTEVTAILNVDPICIFVRLRRRKRAHDAGDLSGGPHPFSFRTRQLSLLEPMVLARGE